MPDVVPGPRFFFGVATEAKQQVLRVIADVQVLVDRRDTQQRARLLHDIARKRRVAGIRAMPAQRRRFQVFEQDFDLRALQRHRIPGRTAAVPWPVTRRA
jgi:hypothetical protein